MKKIINYSLLILLSSYILLRSSEGTLDYYINKRYELFTFITALATFIISSISLCYYVKRAYDQGEFIKLSKNIKLLINDRKFQILIILPFVAMVNLISLLLVSIFIIIPWKNSFLDKILKNNFLSSLSFAIFLILAIIIPAKALGTETISRRLGDLNNVSFDYEESTLSKFSGNTKNYSLRDWIASINYNPDLQSYVGKEVKVSGFVYKPDNTESNIFLVSRFVVTCCAVDARPVGLYSKYQNWEQEYMQDEWVEVEGKFEIIKIDNKDNLLINIEKIKKISQPLDPYIY